MDKVTDAKFKALLSRIQKELLKPKGFKKLESNFRRFHPDGTGQIINFQKSAFNSHGECSFTVNVGIFFCKDPAELDLRFKEYQCQIRTRVSGISGRYRGDHWWTITEVTDEEKMYAQFCVLLEEDILPWLDRLSSRAEVIRAGQRGELRSMIWGNLYQ